ncbi:MAG TPA: AsmA family protein [Candidatus Omnitrophota bacterium]|nr:AsmA family protein [Candidatus Omnitrophota bacterium]
MKKFLMILFIIILIIMVGGAVFLMTLDVDKFRPQIVSQIENAIKKPVLLDKIKLGWQSGMALELRGFAVLKSQQSSEALVKVDSAKALLKLAPLFSRQIQITTIYLDHPLIHLIKKQDGTFEGLESAVQPPSRPQDGNSSGQAAALAFLVNDIRINDGEVIFKDVSGKEPMEINLRKIHVTLANVALNEPIDFKIAAAVFSNGQNLNAQGKLTISPQERTHTVKGFHAALQLAPMDFQEMVKVSPALKTSGIVFPLEGTLTVDADSLKMDDQGLKNEPIKIRLNRGKIRLQSLKDPVENISLDALVTVAMIKVQKFTADLAGGKIEGQGAVNITNPSSPVTAFDVKVDKLKIENLTTSLPQAGPQAKGLLSVVVRGNLTGQTPEDIQQTITAEGTVTLEQAVITHLNILREVFQKLSVIPGLVEKLLMRLPKNYQEKLKTEDTQLKTVQFPFLVKSGVVRLPQIDVSTDSFQVTGSGTYGLVQSDVAGTAVLAIEPDLSGAMIRSVEELQYLTNEKKEIQVPLAIQGRIPKVTVMPDLQFVASKIAAQKAKEVIGGYLEKALGKKETPADPRTTSAKSEPVTAESPTKKAGLLGELLRQGMKEILSEDPASTATEKVL